MKKSKKATLFSVLFMGLGQIYNKEIFKGIILAIIEIVALFNIRYFSTSIKGLISLGDSGVKFVNGKATGDHSIFLMIEGLIAVIILFLVISVYILNIYDAKRGGESIEKGNKPLNTKEFLSYVWEKYFPHIMITPGFLFTVFFIMLPIMFTVVVAFTNYSSPNHLPPRNLVDWVGLDNFKQLVNLKMWNNTFLKVGVWTLIFAVVSTTCNFFVGLFLALITNAKGIRFKKFFRTIFLLPYAIPAFISLLIMRLAFSGPGPVNNMLASFGMGKIPFFTDPTIAKIMILIITVWLGSPYFMALMSGILTNIDKSLYEASEIDGATKWQQFYKITLPLVLFQTMPLLTMSFAYNFNNFGMIYLLTDGNPVNGSLQYAGDTDILISWIYKMTKDQNQYHMASVITIILFIFVASISAYSFSKTKAFKEEDMM
ncbi:sugar ABC transporter permease [Clostridium sp. CF011]|uniref:carbohydrate ABC transporter permease n=1 Tax=unclassified Clostridium TaxID=2614128 RepID=UPI001C0D69F8|nr:MULTISPECIES: sugar ABC transporter permease [unclassified Clostridium]MBU3093209.1 sugar ABC transporter permease [Clostridium sp. CF011]MBW9144728.1 sugar ABC transporter permease [Clostridium sp. CM027]UVE40522.1 sugar ABC transporter permease [Clostridium sp. CM027]WAG69482.1 sugar ABC transporter permease [Clostridium sp. CF011]